MQLARVASPSATPSPSPAHAWARDAGWLLAAGSGVVGLDVLDAYTVRVIVADPFGVEPDERIEADRLMADSACTVLEQAAHGVRLLPTTRTGYVGKLRELAPAQLTFLTSLPGVQRYDLEPTDLDGDGQLAPGELAHRVDVDTEEDVRRVDWLLRDRITEGSVEDGVVSIGVPVRPWHGASVLGAR